MRKVTIVLEDEKLIAALEKVAKETGHTVESVAMRALQFSKMENEYDFAESKKETSECASVSKNRRPLKETSVG